MTVFLIVLGVVCGGVFVWSLCAMAKCGDAQVRRDLEEQAEDRWAA